MSWGSNSSANRKSTFHDSSVDYRGATLNFTSQCRFYRTFLLGLKPVDNLPPIDITMREYHNSKTRPQDIRNLLNTAEAERHQKSNNTNYGVQLLFGVDLPHQQPDHEASGELSIQPKRHQQNATNCVNLCDRNKNNLFTRQRLLRCRWTNTIFKHDI